MADDNIYDDSVYNEDPTTEAGRDHLRQLIVELESDVESRAEAYWVDKLVELGEKLEEVSDLLRIHARVAPEYSSGQYACAQCGRAEYSPHMHNCDVAIALGDERDKAPEIN